MLAHFYLATPNVFTLEVNGLEAQPPSHDPTPADIQTVKYLKGQQAVF